ncbi:MAG: ABC transporter ATP-binding protein [Alphaproteobacteria bacterium]|nr:ABC transporter ATP-binding protein [Alphaproteobacteria bacterium]
MSPLLTVRNVTKVFSGLTAVRNLSFNVEKGSIVGLIGPNGAGKTTLFNMIAGVFAPNEGEILLGNHVLSNLKSERICHAGIGRTFQIVRPFSALSVLDNVIIGALHKHSDVKNARAAARDILNLLGLSNKAENISCNLTLQERKRLEVARALATEPKLLLLDEVMAGLRPNEAEEMISVFRNLNKERGLTILLIEHVMQAVMKLSHEICVLHHGELIAHGSPEQVVRDPLVLDCYLGKDPWT